jgi:hypothetical protein
MHGKGLQGLLLHMARILRPPAHCAQLWRLQRQVLLNKVSAALGKSSRGARHRTHSSTATADGDAAAVAAAEQAMHELLVSSARGTVKHLVAIGWV